MAGNNWKMGVIVNVGKNSKMRDYIQRGFMLNAETGTGSQLIQTADDTGTALDLRDDPYNVNVGSLVKLGPSNDSDNLDGVEEVAVTAITAAAITAVKDYDYSAEDQIQVETIPRGWSAEDTSGISGKLYSRVDGQKYGNGTADLGIGNGCKITRGVETEIATTSEYFLDEGNSVAVTATLDAKAIGDIGAANGHGILKFDLSSLAGKTIKSATITIGFTSQVFNGVGGNLRAYYIKRNWKVFANSPSWDNYDNGVAWATPGGYGAADATDAGGTYQPITSGTPGTATFTLTNSVVQDLVDGVLTDYGFVIWNVGTGSQSYIVTDNPAVISLNITFSDDSNTTHTVQYETQNGTLKASLLHRFLYYAKCAGTFSQCQTAITTYDATATGSVTASTGTLIQAYTEWTRISSTFTPAATSTRLIQAFKIQKSITESTTYEFTDTYIVHAEGTSDEASGELTLDKNPRLSSVRSTFITGERSQTGYTNRVNKFDQSGGRVRWTLEGSFRNITKAQYDDLIIMKEHNRGANGNILIEPDLSHLPATLAGNFQLGEVIYEDPALDKITVPFTFVEA